MPDNQRMSTGFQEFDLRNPCPLQSGDDPFCRGSNIAAMVRQRAHAGNPQKLKKLGQMCVFAIGEPRSPPGFDHGEGS